MKKYLAILIAVLMLAAAFAGCSATKTDSASTGTAEQAADNATAPAADNTAATESEINQNITIMTYNGATGLNPMDGTAVDQVVGLQVFDRLFKIQPDFAPTTCLAESYEVSNDELTYTIKLKNGVKFHNGDTMTMDDVIFSFDTYIASANGYNVDCIASYKALDDTTLEIVVNDASAKLLETLCLYPAIVCKAAYEADPVGFTDAPVGTGAYKFVSRGDDSAIYLEAFEDYHNGAPSIKTITFTQPMDSSTATIALETGELDIITVVPISQIATIEAAENCSVFSEPGPAQCQMMFTGEPFLSNEKLRGAVYHAINPENIISINCLGNGAAAQNFYSATLLGEYAGMVDISGRYNPELAKQLLEESGFDTSLEIVLDCDAGQAKIAQIIQSDLAAIGLKTSIQQLEIPVLVGNVKSGLATVLIWEAGELDMSLLDILHNHTSEGSALYGVKDAGFDALEAAAAAETTDLAKRDELMKTAYQYLVDHWMMVPFYDSLDICAYNNRVQNIHLLGVEYVLYVCDLTLTA